MRVSKVSISNYKSFSETPEVIRTDKKAIVVIGRNNSGKSNFLSAIELLLGSRDPRYIKVDEDDFNDTTKPFEIEIEILADEAKEIYDISALPQKHKTAFYAKFLKDKSSAAIVLRLKLSIAKYILEDEAEEADAPDVGFTITAAGMIVHTKVSQVRQSLCKLLCVPSIRSAKDDLSGSKWTPYGILMKSVMEDSPRFSEVQEKMTELNGLIESVLAAEKAKILSNSKVIAFIEDIKFQLTKNNNPVELIRSLEILVKDKAKYFHLENTGTGTQSALIISILELALSYKTTKSKLFIVEEPEIFLHPQGIRYLGSLLQDFQKDGVSQVICSTHSSIFLSSFSPNEIIRIDKSNGYSKAYQLSEGDLDPDNKITRCINSENAEMFYADMVFLTEGETEKIIFPSMSKSLKDAAGKDLFFLKNNVAVINCQGIGSVLQLAKILDKFKIRWKALVDNDFFDRSSIYSPVYKYLSIDGTADRETIRGILRTKGIAVLKAGETEDLISNEDVSTITGKPVEEIIEIKSRIHKTSEAFEKEIFKKSKPEYAHDVVTFYQGLGKSPFDEVIKWFYS